MTITERYYSLLRRIRAYEKKYNNTEGAVKTVVVTKAQSPEVIQQLIKLDHRDFGENYLQEAIIKIQALKNNSLAWHFIGKIQSNKTRLIAEYFDWVQSVDRLKIAERLNEQRPITLPPLNVCIEVNPHNLPYRAGLATEEVEETALKISALPNLKLRGLMYILLPTQDLSVQFERFHTIAKIQQKLIDKGLQLDTLSMGMSDDFEMAIKAGSNMVRVGTAIFGERLKK